MIAGVQRSADETLIGLEQWRWRARQDLSARMP
jgi:hypothetical protein